MQATSWMAVKGRPLIQAQVARVEAFNNGIVQQQETVRDQAQIVIVVGTFANTLLVLVKLRFPLVQSTSCSKLLPTEKPHDLEELRLK